MTPTRNLLSYRGLVREIAVTDFKLKYQGSVLGYAWSLGKPLTLFAVLYVVFTQFFRLGSSVPHYALYLLLGVVLWAYFSESTMGAMSSIVDRGDLIRKVYFPRILIVLSASVSALITLALNLVVLSGILLVSGVGLSLRSLLIVPLLIELYLLSLGCGFFLAALYVRYRDFRHIWELGLQVAFYASPVIYPLEIMPRHLAQISALNPIAQILQDARAAMVYHDTLTTLGLVAFPVSLLPYLVPPLLVIAGYFFFESAAARFAEEI